MRLFAALLVGSLALAGGFVTWERGGNERLLARIEARAGSRIAPLDVVFQELECGLRCELIREVTGSRYTHVGIVLLEGEQRMVWEALGPVGPVPLAEWIARTDGRVAIARPSAQLRRQGAEIAAQVRAMRGLPYDGDYQWDDERIYCSELVAKAVQRATGVELSPPRTFLLGARAGQIARMSRGRLTEETRIVSPGALLESPLLTRLP